MSTPPPDTADPGNAPASTDGAEFDLCASDALADGGRRTFDVNGRSVLLLRIDGGFYAVENLCSHARARLEGGRLKGFEIGCPLHGARFDVRDGRCTAAPARRPIAAFALRIAHGRVFATVPAPAARAQFGPLN